MKYLVLIISATLIFSGCEYGINNTHTAMNNSEEPRVTGLGGVFFMVENPEQTRDWHKNNIDLITNEYGSLFEFSDTFGNTCYAQWSPFSNKTTYFEPSEKEFMLNFRVDDLESLLRKFNETGVTVLDSIESYEYGKFLHILDIDGNKIELWEPVDNVFTKLYKGKTTNLRWILQIDIKATNPDALRQWYTYNLGIKFKDGKSVLPFKSTSSSKEELNFNLNFIHYSDDAYAGTTKEFSVVLGYPAGDKKIKEYISRESGKQFYSDLDKNLFLLRPVN